MTDIRNSSARKERHQPRRRSWTAFTLALSLGAHIGVAAMLWVERPAQPIAGAAIGIEIVAAPGAVQAAAAESAAASSGARVRNTAPAKPEPAPEPEAFKAPEAPRAAREAPARTPSPDEPPRPDQPQSVARPPTEIALRPPLRTTPAAATLPAPEAAHWAARRPRAEPRIAEIVLKRPARVPPPPTKSPRLAASAPARGDGEHAARSQTASVPIVAADAAPAAGPETGASPPRYGFGSAANPIPRYPREARERGWEGVVTLSVSVAADGRAESVSISRGSGHSLLDAAAVDAVRRWRFEPARRGGFAVAGTAIVPIRFRLED